MNGWYIVLIEWMERYNGKNIFILPIMEDMEYVSKDRGNGLLLPYLFVFHCLSVSGQHHSLHVAKNVSEFMKSIS